MAEVRLVEVDLVMGDHGSKARAQRDVLPLPPPLSCNTYTQLHQLHTHYHGQHLSKLSHMLCRCLSPHPEAPPARALHDTLTYFEASNALIAVPVRKRPGHTELATFLGQEKAKEVVEENRRRKAAETERSRKRRAK